MARKRVRKEEEKRPINERIRTLISQYESEGSFTHVSPTPEAMARVRDELGVALPEQFLQYLEEYGHSGIGGASILGIGLDGTAVFVEETLDYRKDGLPLSFAVIENCNEWLYCIDCSNGGIVS